MIWIYVALSIIGFIGLCMWVFPIYNVWASEKSGEAQLKEANFKEQIAIAEANARLKSAEMNKKAEIVEAEAVAESISTIGDGLKKNQDYLRYLWIKNMAETKDQLIYIPTEGGMPILEAGRRKEIAAKDEDEEEEEE